MAFDLDQPAELKLTRQPVEPPSDWSDAAQFGSLRLALEAALENMDEAPWIRSGGAMIKPAEIDGLWKQLFRPRSD